MGPRTGATPKDLDIFDFGELKTFFEAQVGARFDDVEPTGQLAEFWRVASGDRRPRRYQNISQPLTSEIIGPTNKGTQAKVGSTTTGIQPDNADSTKM